MFCEFRPKSELIGRQDSFAVTERIEFTELNANGKAATRFPECGFFKANPFALGSTRPSRRGCGFFRLYVGLILQCVENSLGIGLEWICVRSFINEARQIVGSLLIFFLVTIDGPNVEECLSCAK